VTRRVGLFGGTFDPPHLGHLLIAEWALEELELDRVVFMPAGSPPHKRRHELSAADARIAMTRLATSRNPRFRVSTLETRRRGLSFTVDTLRELKRSTRGADLVLILGADSLDDFRNWHAPREIMRLATLAVAARPAAHRVRRRRGVVALQNPPLALSSSAIRARVRAGRSVRYLVPDAVARYIARHRLYAGRS
jgi:nicotinate-nucleotide adenylyltransferase